VVDLISEGCCCYLLNRCQISRTFNCTDPSSLCSSVSCALLCLSRSFLNLSLLFITVYVLVSLLCLEFSNNFSINCGVFWFLLDIFVYGNVWIIPTNSLGISGYVFQDFSVHEKYEPFCYQCGAFRLFQNFSVHETYEPFYYQCGAFWFLLDFFVYETYKQFLLTSVGFSGFVQETFGHVTYEPLLPIILGLAQAHPNYIISTESINGLIKKQAN